jgi:hypothetical protein
MTMATYTCSGSTYEAVCDHVGWDPEIHPIEVRVAGKVVYARGTALKPNEWETLIARNGSTLADGRTLRISGIPDRFRVR